MIKIIAPLLMLCIYANIQAQPSLSSFTNTTQRNQLTAYIIWQAKTEAKKAADSVAKVVRAEYAAALKPTVLDTSFLYKTTGVLADTLKGKTWKLTALQNDVILSNSKYGPLTAKVITLESVAAGLTTRIKSIEDKAPPSGADYNLLKQYIDNLKVALSNLPK